MKTEKVLDKICKKVNKIIFFFCLILINCQEKNTSTMINSSLNEQTKITDKEVQSVLIKQLKSGAASEYGSFDDYSEKDLNVLVDVEDSILKQNNYKQPDKEEFLNKIKNVFGRTIEYSSASNYLKIDTYNPCDKNLVFNPLSADNKNLYISKSKKIITFFYPLPLVLDYQKRFPNLLQYENEKITIETNEGNQNITQWKNYPNLLQERKKNNQVIIARNMYLFNDNKAHFKWLILNDEYFMTSLVKTFGYTDDQELLKWVVERTKFDKNNPADYGKLFWTKQCDGSIILHSNTFKLLQKLYQPNDTSENRFILNYIKDYLEYLGDKDESQSEVLKEVDRVKIMSNLAYFAEQYKYDKRFVSGHGDVSKIMGRLRFFLNDADIEILKVNNYFNMPKFKEWWDNADYDEYYVMNCEYAGTCGPDNPSMTEEEWRKKHPKK